MRHNSQMEKLGLPGKAVRLAITASVIGLLLASSSWGSDDDFPFAPFHMFASADNGNRPVKSTRLEGISAQGNRMIVGGGEVGLRRAEFEGQIGRFRKDRQLMAALATAYHQRHPNRPELVQIDVVVRHYELKNSKPTKKYHDIVEVSWRKNSQLTDSPEAEHADKGNRHD